MIWEVFLLTKRSGVFDVQVDVRSLLNPANQPKKDLLTIETALETVSKQMQVSGYRKRTISDYQLHVNHFANVNRIEYVSEINSDTIYNWLDSMKVSNQTKLTRLKCLKAFLSRCFDNGWFEANFWKMINVKVDKKVKTGATSNDIGILLSLLDLSDFVELRDAVAVLTLYKTGIRINTLGQLQEHHIDFNEMIFNLDGSILKNHQTLKLPIDETLANLLKVLIEQNNKIRKKYGEKNTFVFITKKGKMISTSSTNNNISKRLNKYSHKYGLKNINPHAIRRGYAKELLKKGANLALISKALGHSSLQVTTQYLDIDVNEVATNLRAFL